MRPLALALAVALIAFPAGAQVRPDPVDPAVPQIRRAVFREHAAYALVGQVRTALTVTFWHEEAVVRVVVGDQEVWAVPKPDQGGQSEIGHVLALYPVSKGRTTIQVVTRRANQTQRVYQFLAEVRERPAEGDDPDATFGLSFDYPGDAAERAARAKASAAAARQAKNEAALAALEGQQIARSLMQTPVGTPVPAVAQAVPERPR